MNSNSDRSKPGDEDRIKSHAKRPFRILLADDDKEMRSLLCQAFHKAGYLVLECSDGLGLLDYLESFLFPEKEAQQYVDLIISDIRMPGFTGMEILEGIQYVRGFPPMILITAFGDDETHNLAKKFGAAAMFDKPFDIDDLLDKVRELFSQVQKP